MVLRPRTSMMSISPLYGHGRPVRKSAPIIQNAGQRPLPFGHLDPGLDPAVLDV